MSDIIRVAAPITNKNIVQPMKEQISTEQSSLELSEVSRAVKANPESSLLEQNNSNIDQSMTAEVFQEILKDPNITVNFIKSIADLQENINLIGKQNLAVDENFAEEFDKLFNELAVKPENLANELLNQEQLSTSFKGELFDFLRQLSKESPAPGARNAIANLLKSLIAENCKPEIFKTLTSSLNYLGESLSFDNDLAEKLFDLSERFSSPDAEKNFPQLKKQAEQLLSQISKNAAFDGKLKNLCSMIKYNLSRFNTDENSLDKAVNKLLKFIPKQESKTDFMQKLYNCLSEIENKNIDSSAKIFDSLVKVLQNLKNNEGKFQSGDKNTTNNLSNFFLPKNSDAAKEIEQIFNKFESNAENTVNELIGNETKTNSDNQIHNDINLTKQNELDEQSNNVNYKSGESANKTNIDGSESQLSKDENSLNQNLTQNVKNENHLNQNTDINSNINNENYLSQNLTQNIKNENNLNQNANSNSDIKNENNLNQELTQNVKIENDLNQDANANSNIKNENNFNQETNVNGNIKNENNLNQNTNANGNIKNENNLNRDAALNVKNENKLNQDVSANSNVNNENSLNQNVASNIRNDNNLSQNTFINIKDESSLNQQALKNVKQTLTELLKYTSSPELKNTVKNLLMTIDIENNKSEILKNFSENINILSKGMPENKNLSEQLEASFDKNILEEAIKETVKFIPDEDDKINFMQNVYDTLLPSENNSQVSKIFDALVKIFQNQNNSEAKLQENSESFSDTVSANAEKLKEAINGLLLKSENLAKEFVNTKNIPKTFKGELFENLRDILKENSSSELKDSIVNLLKSINIESSKPEIINDFSAELTEIADNLLDEVKNLSNENLLNETVKDILKFIPKDEDKVQFLQKFHNFISGAEKGNGNSKVMNTLVKILQKQTDNESVMQMKGENVESVIHSLLSSPSNFAPLLHFALPIDDGILKAFGEMWINPDEEETKTNKKSKSSSETSERMIHMLLVFEIQQVGKFETELWVKDKKITMSLLCPPDLKADKKELSADLRKSISFSQYSFEDIKVGKLEKNRSLAEVFPTLPQKRNGINVRI